jgi:hypothetical protein
MWESSKNVIGMINFVVWHCAHLMASDFKHKGRKNAMCLMNDTATFSSADGLFVPWTTS